MWKSHFTIRWSGPFFLFPVAMFDRVRAYCLGQLVIRQEKVLYTK